MKTQSETSIERLWLTAYRTSMSPFILKAIGIAEAQAALERLAAESNRVRFARPQGGMRRSAGGCRRSS